MPAVTDQRLPAITYEVVPPQLPDTLPRMDVAGFVGYASTGPVDVPVVVDDVAGFRDTFGPDVPLARDAGSGAWSHGHLGAAVEEFLRNGGRRCWVVRVASRDAAGARFPAPGLLGMADAAGRGRAGELVARAVGDWADGLRVAAALGAQRLPPVEVLADEPRLRIPARVSLQPGDLLRATIDGGVRSELLVVARATVATDGATEVTWDGRLTLAPDDPGDAVVVGEATVVTVAGEQPLGEVSATVMGDTDRVLDVAPAALPVGAIVRIELDDHGLLAPVRGSAPGQDGTLVGPCQRTVGAPIVPAHVLPHGGSASSDHPDDDALGGLDVDVSSSVVVERLTLSLSVYEDGRLRAHIDGLTFDARHPEHWGALPDDQALFTRHARQAGADGRGRRPPGSADARLPALWQRVVGPRFPLAAPAGTSGTWFPIGVPDLATPDDAFATVSPTEPDDRRRRAGLATFDPSVFTDPGLHDVAPDGLSSAVDARANRTDPPPFRGVHALFPIDEVTLVAVPDASHPGWHVRREARERPPEAPVLLAPVHDDGIVLWWSPSAGADRYVLEEAATLDLAAPRVRFEGVPVLTDGPDGSVGVRLPSMICRTTRAFRVRAVGADARTSPWSNTVHTFDPPTTFVDGDDPHLPAPIVALVDDDDAPSGLRLTWSTPDDLGLGEDVSVEVVRSSDPLFSTAHRPDTGGIDHMDLPAAGDQHAFYRARHLDPAGQVGPWSVTVVQPARDRQVLESRVPSPGEVSSALLDVHRALLRFTAGRGDVLALLSLPAAYREHETLTHLASLRGANGPGGAAEPQAPLDEQLLANAAVFAPWTTVRSPAGVRAVPPDGAVAGVIAHRTVERGAWISPGNQPLAGVAALGHELAAAERGALLGAGVNLLVPRPVGVVAITAVTLADDPTTRPIEVRRLLHLLRRLALRHGATYVFEPNGHRFRSKVRRTFQRLLGELFERGAFAGTRPSEGFQVVADHTVNPPQALDAGRFVVELRVAPTRAMTFVRVRLVQTGPGDPVAVEVSS